MDKRWIIRAAAAAIGLAVSTKSLGFEGSDLWAEHHEAGRAAMQEGNAAEAERQWQTALRIGNESKDGRLAKTILELAHLYMREHRYDRAAGMYKSIFDAIGSPLPEDSTVASLAGNYGLALFNLRKYDEAERWYRRTLEIHLKTDGPQSMSTAVDYNNLAQLCAALKKYDEAEKLYQEFIGIAKKAQGEESAAVASGLNNLGELYRLQNRLTDAEPLVKRALEIDRKIRPESWETAADMNNLGLIYLGGGQAAKAIPLLEGAEEMITRRFGPTFGGLGELYTNLSLAYRMEKNLDGAIATERKALKLCERLMGAQHPVYAQGLSSVAELYLMQGKYKEAEPLFKQGIALWLRAAGPDDPGLAVAMENYSNLLRRTNRGEQVEALYSQAREIRAKHDRAGTARAE